MNPCCAPFASLPPLPFVTNDNRCFQLFLVTRRLSRKIRLLFLVPIKISYIIVTITVRLRGIIVEDNGRHSSKFRLHFDRREVKRGKRERDESGRRGREEKGKDQKGAEGTGEEGEGRQVVAIKSWTGPRRRKASVVAWVERGPVTSTISRFDRADRGKKKKRRRGRKRARWAAEAAEGAGEGKKRREVEEDEGSVDDRQRL